MILNANANHFTLTVRPTALGEPRTGRNQEASLSWLCPRGIDVSGGLYQLSTSASASDAASWEDVAIDLVSPDGATRRVAATALRERLVAALDQSDVRAWLSRFGISSDEAQGRVPSLSDLEIAELTLLLNETWEGAAEDPTAAMLEVLARTIASVLVLPREVMFAAFGLACDDPFEALEA